MMKQRMMFSGALVAATLSMGILSGCHSDDQDKAQAPGTAPTEQVAPQAAQAESSQHFVGTLPCADCEGIRTDVTLKFTKDGQPQGFTMTEAYLGAKDSGENHAFNSEGDFAVLTGTTKDPKAVVYHLMPKDDEPTYYQRVDDSTLRLLDNSMNPIESEHSYDLKLAK